ncbi:membrane protein insertion efficiency factor YidD [Candidatus Peregrinibacteria bacterium]|nr:membrane protein insertion efficiency factor YidD [Candidatus Peregrinibacteria bacterium]
MLKNLLSIPRKPFLALIRLYQKTFSPDHGFVKILFPEGYCKFSPTCSEYGYQAIEKYGLVRGVPLAVWRVMRCNPWNPGGSDPIR